MLDFLVFYDNGPHWYLKEFKDYENDLKKLQNDVALKNLNYRGLTNEIIQLASKKFNFTVHYTVRCTNTKINRYQITGMKNYHGRFGTLINLQNVLISDDKKMYKMSETLGTTDFYYLVTLNDLYTNYEKLLMPFDFSTWILLTIVLLLTFGVIFISYLCPRKIQKLVFGEGVQNPAYNALGVIFGIGQLRLPHESVNRMILLIFLWFCLIFRTCYQSMLFEFMTSDMRKPLPASINDLKEMNYTIVVIKNDDNDKIYNDEIISNRERPKIIYKTGSEYLAMYKQALDGRLTSKYAFFTTNFIHSFLNKTFQNTLTIMENEKLTKLTAYSIIESYNNLLLSNFNFIIHQLIPSGITNYLVDHAIWLLQRPFDVEIEDSRRILSMRDLEFGFVLWLASLSLPIICFLCEISILFYRKIKRVLEEIFVKIFIFLALKLMMEKNHAKW
ncbi:hypothetical protein PVAND_016049 [Polypedilum vanderplanki]|nr:hypothetical protein PVAND_016049 [Polypedilum vanderplanki]